jgi:hypothetical protein
MLSKVGINIVKGSQHNRRWWTITSSTPPKVGKRTPVGGDRMYNGYRYGCVVKLDPETAHNRKAMAALRAQRSPLNKQTLP